MQNKERSEAVMRKKNRRKETRVLMKTIRKGKEIKNGEKEKKRNDSRNERKEMKMQQLILLNIRYVQNKNESLAKIFFFSFLFLSDSAVKKG